MDLQLTDKVAVVTGANKGIGLAITQALVAEEAWVVAGSLSTENLDGMDRVTAVAVDLMADDGPARLVQTAIDKHGQLDVLVNNVGAVRIRTGGFLATSDEEFDWALKMDFFTGLRATRAALGPMLAQRSGSIVNIASVNSFFQPDAATVDYGVAKAAVVNLSKSLSQEFGPKGVRVNCVSPGQVSTDLWLGEHGVAETVAQATGVNADTIREAAASAIATGRFTTPQEVATLVTMLASDRTANVTGVNYVIDGGLIKTI
ncbi:MAG: SDR family oxidoreductase [Solirubrobacterales bacterium]|nr:SDR family oxidoreductase [Solirubrobacterales bacterium]